LPEKKNGEGSNLSESVLLIPKCNSYEILEQEVARIKEGLDALLGKSKKIFGTDGRFHSEQVDGLRRIGIIGASSC